MIGDLLTDEGQQWLWQAETQSKADFISFTHLLLCCSHLNVSRFKPILISHQENAKGGFQMITINIFVYQGEKYKYLTLRKLTGGVIVSSLAQESESSVLLLMKDIQKLVFFWCKVQY